MSSRYSNVEKHSGHDEDQCGVRRSARSESAMALKHSRDCCAPYQPKARRHRHQILSSNSLIASSPSSCSESAWLHYNCRRSNSSSPSISKLCGRRNLSTNNSIVDMTQRRQLFGSGTAADMTARLSTTILSDFAFRILPSRLRENEFNFEETRINKIFASHWLNERQVVMGTKCNKLLVFDVVSHQVSYIPMLKSSGRYPTADPPCGIHAISINPSSTLLATGGHSTNDIAIYSLPTFDPVAVCENGHADWVFGIDWVDDQFFVSGSRDSNICLYRVDTDVLQNQSVNRSKSHSKSSDIISSSTPVDTELYRYSASTSHAWTTVSTRSSVASVRTPGPVFVPSDHRDDDDDDSDSESDSGDANENAVTPESRIGRPPLATLELLRLHHNLAGSLSSRQHVQFLNVGGLHAVGGPMANVGNNDGGGDDEGGDEGDDEDDDDSDSEDLSPGPQPPLYTPASRSHRPILRPVRRQPRSVDSWDMDEVEDEQDTSRQSSIPRSNRVPAHPCVTPLETLNCDRAEKIRAVSYNKWRKQVATLSLNAYFHLIDINTFRSVEEPLRLRHTRENVCMTVNEDGSLFAVGSQSHVSFVDPRVLKHSGTKSIDCKQRGCGIRSLSFKNDVLTIGTGQGSVYFYDVRAEKYLELFCGASVQLEAGVGWLNHDDTYHDFFVGHEYPNAIYTHCYDPAGTRLFTAGGPLPAGLYGNYAALWH